ncbi:MAG: hypothetical protein M0017_04145 [Desulfobacteraceae bacterium]|nr:hypothetical protein [Desulfobacteraceae bacterium]
MIDPELKYCPRCRDEYRAEIARCAACGIDLLTGAELLARERGRQEKLAARKGEITIFDKVVTIEKGPLPDMDHLAKLMAAERIATRLAGDEKSCGKSCCSSTFSLQVREEDAADAMRILAAEHRRTTACEHHPDYADAVFDPAAGKTTCPACGFSFPTTTTTCPDCGLCFG